MHGPYREAPRDPAYLCGICWATASVQPGECCGQSRLPLGTEAVENLVREEVQRRRNLRSARDKKLIIAGTVVGAPLLCWAADQYTLILGAILGCVGAGAVVKDIAMRVEGWPQPWTSPFPRVLRFLGPRVVDGPAA